MAIQQIKVGSTNHNLYAWRMWNTAAPDNRLMLGYDSSSQKYYLRMEETDGSSYTGVIGSTSHPWHGLYVSKINLGKSIWTWDEEESAVVLTFSS